MDQLICANCGATPTELEAKYTAKAGGTHAKRLQHGFGAPGRNHGVKLRSCGPWVSASSSTEERAAAMQAWQEAKARP